MLFFGGVQLSFDVKFINREIKVEGRILGFSLLIMAHGRERVPSGKAGLPLNFFDITIQF